MEFFGYDFNDLYVYFFYFGVLVFFFMWIGQDWVGLGRIGQDWEKLESLNLLGKVFVMGQWSFFFRYIVNVN